MSNRRIRWMARTLSVLLILGGTGSVVLAQNLDTGRVGHWQMDEGSGTTASDASGGGHTGTLLNQAGWIAGKVGPWAVTLDGSATFGDYVEVPDHNDLDLTTAITIAAWIRPRRVATQSVVTKAVNGGTNGYELTTSTNSGLSPNKVFMRFNQVASGDTYRVATTSNYPTDGTTWAHVAGTYDGTTMRIYYNGTLQNSVAGPAAIATNTLTLKIGAEGATVRALQGDVDDVRIYNRALSGTEVGLLYTCGDGDVDAGEQCDDGNIVNGDCCSSSCQYESAGSPCADDGNGCTNDQCNGSGVCAHPNNTAPCSDGLFCNGTDTCSGGSCSAHGGDPCAANVGDADADCSESCNETTDDCTATDPNGSSCEDNVFCNGDDACNGGACSVHDGNPCPGQDIGPACNDSCNEAAEDCTAPDVASTSCDDGLFCTATDTCNGSGTCVGTGDPCSGPDGDGNCAESCDEGADNCFANDPNGSPCAGNGTGECSGADTCQGGLCQNNDVAAGTPCTDTSPPSAGNCKDAQCNGSGVCDQNFANEGDGTGCNDSLFCNGTDTCNGGTCSTHSGNPCPGHNVGPDCNDSCDEAGDTCTANDVSGTSCNDGQFCTATDTCNGSGTCVGTGDPCTGGPECNNVCNEGADNCAVSAGTACTDDGNVCTNDECNGSGACGHPNNTAPCTDNLYCNGTDTCSGGSCSSHGGDPCTGGTECADACNEAADNCFDTAGTSCTDDGNVCTNDECNGSGACGHPNNTAACDDGVFCNGTDTCSGGSCGHSGDPCTGGTECANACNETADNCFDTASTPCTADGNVCTDDVCNGAGACGVNNTAACDDGLYCNGTDTCSGGSCGHSGDPCTSGVCNETSDQCVAATGCPLAPQQTCRTAAKSILVAKDNSDDTKDRLVWKWIRGAATTLEEFGDPTATAVYKLCLYTGTPGEFVDEASVPAGGSTWRLAGTTKYLYTDSAATADGIKKVLLKSGEAGKARTLVKGKGAALPDLGPPVADPPVVTVQLLNGGNGMCWGASYSGAQVLKNQEGMLKAKAP